MKTRVFSLFVVLVLISLVSAPAASASATSASANLANGPLQPGVTVTYAQKVPVNIVFVGYSPRAVSPKAVLKELAGSYTPVVRYPQFYGLPGRDMGLKYNFDYHLAFTDSAFNNRFFSYLRKSGTSGAPTAYQLAYNDQQKNVLDVGPKVLYIDAPSVEQWLARSLPQNKGYTIVFINWYGRPDFKFHLYTKTDQPNPDTGYNFGALRDSRKMIAWGGGETRLWFYDLSAGPEAWSTNYIVDQTDLDGNGVEDYRMPPIWEYAPGGYRSPSALSKDLGLVARYVAIDLLFTPSPLYDPLASAPQVSGKKIVQINMLEDDPASLGTDWIHTDLVQSKFRGFEPYYSWRTNLIDRNPIDPAAQRAFRIFADLLPENDCWNDYGLTFAELFCFFDMHRSEYIPAYGKADAVAGIYAFNTLDENLGSQNGLLGFADDNWVDGTPSYVFQFDTAGYRELGYGFSDTTIHEGGHHFGLSHPHDGYDSATGVDYGVADAFYYSWSGDESHTVMNYLAITNDFGRFNQDNMYRWETAGYLNWSNELLAKILASPKANRQRERIGAAESYAGKAIASFHAWSYLDAAANARRAYEQLARAAAELGIAGPQTSPLRVAPFLPAPHEGDPIRYPDN
jgi:hypothetical protein